jgi:hypothetical protein
MCLAMMGGRRVWLIEAMRACVTVIGKVVFAKLKDFFEDLAQVGPALPVMRTFTRGADARRIDHKPYRYSTVQGRPGPLASSPHNR